MSEDASISTGLRRNVRPRSERHHVVVVGSGFGGLFAVKRLKRAALDVTLVSRTSYHLFQPLLYQVATGILSQGEIAPPTREVLARQNNAAVLLGDVTDIDLAGRTVTSHVLGRPTVITYDSLIVAAGASQSYFGNEEFATFAPGMKTIDDALELRGRIFGAFELAELRSAAGEDVDHLLTFIVVGAGPTGVEMAGQIAELAHRTLHRDFRSIRTRDARIVLVDAAPNVLMAFGERLGDRADKALRKLGVEVLTSATVKGVDARGIDLDLSDGTTRRIDAVTKVWAAGVQASELAQTLAAQCGAEMDRSGRIKVNRDLTLPGHPEVFVVGDMMSLDNLPGVAQVAIQGAEHAAKSVARSAAGRVPPQPFTYRDKGSMATISRFRAVAQIGKVSLSGFPAWLMWLTVHLLYITGFKNRLTTFGHWIVSFMGRGRSERTSTQQQIFARLAFAQLPGGVASLASGQPDNGADRASTPATQDPRDPAQP